MTWKNSEGVLCVCVRSGCKYKKTTRIVLGSTDPPGHHNSFRLPVYKDVFVCMHVCVFLPVAAE